MTHSHATPRSVFAEIADGSLVCVLLVVVVACSSTAVVQVPAIESDGPPAGEADAGQLALYVEVIPDGEGAFSLDARAELESPVPQAEWSFVLEPTATGLEVELDGRTVQTRRDADGRVHVHATDASATVLGVRYRLPIPAATVPSLLRPWSHGDWVFLSGHAAWYPQVEGAPHVAIEVRAPRGLEPLTIGRRIELPSASATMQTRRFESERPLVAGLTLALGPWVRTSREVGSVDMHVLTVRDRSPDLVARYLGAFEVGLPRLEAWLGAFPFSDFTLAEFPIQSLQAFPGFALVDPAYLERRRTLATGALHELAHSWLGYTVLLGLGGNWIEGLTTYLVEHELTTRASLASGKSLRKRLLREHALAATGLDDLPVTLFRSAAQVDRRTQGYAKVAMIFHMLRMTIGDEAFFDGLRSLVQERALRPTSWDDVMLVFEGASDRSLARFSVEWLERTGAPTLRLDEVAVLGPVHAHATTAPHRVRFTITQGDPAYELSVPVVFELEGAGRFDTVVEIAAQSETIIELDVPASPVTLRIDPGYEVFRELAPDEIEATFREGLGAGSLWVTTREAERFERVRGELELATLEALPVGTQLADAPGEGAGVEVVLADGRFEPFPGGQLERTGADIVLGDRRLADGHSIAAAARRSDGTPWILVIATNEDAIRPMIAGLAALGSMSWVEFDAEHKPIRAGLWPVEATSMMHHFERTHH